MNRAPVSIMFHSVGLSSWAWRSAAVSDSIEHFETRMAALAKAGYSSEFFADGTCRAGNRRRRIALTFDDGYLDNWVHVFPVLQQYGFKATIFVSCEFVDPRNIVRPCIATGSVVDREHQPGTCCAGFLSWPEMRAMEKSGLIDVQSHCMSHTWYFSGPRIVDFWRPGAATVRDGPVWLLWNEVPSAKPFYLTQAADRESCIPYGTPIYEHGKALITRRYFPPEDVEEALVKHVAENGGADFFWRSEWASELRRVAQVHGSGHGGRYEADAEYSARVRYELGESKLRLQENLGKEITGVCWPGGGLSDEVLRTAQDVGYRRFTMPTTWPHRKTQPGSFIPRLPGGGRLVFRQQDCGEITPRAFQWRIEAFRGSLPDYFLSRAWVRLRYGRALLRQASACSRQPQGTI